MVTNVSLLQHAALVQPPYQGIAARSRFRGHSSYAVPADSETSSTLAHRSLPLAVEKLADGSPPVGPESPA
jgi:hypothetical protein